MGQQMFNKIIVLLGCIIVHTGLLATACPATLSIPQLSELRQTGLLTYNKTVFILDGASLSILKSHPKLKLTTNPPYVRHANHRNSCWYGSDAGYIGLTEK